MPRTGRNIKRENEVRRIKTAKAREDKAVIGYIMKKYPKVYEEGRKYVQELHLANPNKIDLTKTSQFRAMVNAPHFTDNMELKIELMDEAGETSKIELMDESSQALQTAETSEDLKAATR